MSLPEFKQGAPLTADALNVLADRVRAMQGRAPGAAAVSTAWAVGRFIPGRRYGFELAAWNGLVWVRQGWVDAGNGHLYSVGVREWNDLGPLRPMTVWLEMTETEGEVKVTEYDENTPETNLRRRLGYVREVPGEGEDAAPVWHCVQLLGGLVAPAAPRRTLGYSERTAVPEKGDVTWELALAGNLRGVGYKEVPGRYYGGRSVNLRYGTNVHEVWQQAARGGNRLAMTLHFRTD